MKMKSIAVSAVLTLCSPLAWAASSSFQNSCSNTQMSVSDNGVRISAECRTKNGAYNATSILVRGISNDDGRLRGKSGAPTSFQHSCRKITLNMNTNQVALQAICKTRSGSERKTRLELTNIENRNGRLVLGSN